MSPRVHGELTDTQTFEKKFQSTRGKSLSNFYLGGAELTKFLMAKWKKREKLWSGGCFDPSGSSV